MDDKFKAKSKVLVTTRAALKAIIYADAFLGIDLLFIFDFLETKIGFFFLFFFCKMTFYSSVSGLCTRTTNN